MTLSPEEHSQLRMSFRRKEELEGILLSIRERARSGKSKHHGETEFMAQVTQRRIDEVEQKIRKLTSRR